MDYFYCMRVAKKWLSLIFLYTISLYVNVYAGDFDAINTKEGRSEKRLKKKVISKLEGYLKGQTSYESFSKYILSENESKKLVENSLALIKEKHPEISLTPTNSILPSTDYSPANNLKNRFNTCTSLSLISEHFSKFMDTYHTGVFVFRMNEEISGSRTYFLLHVHVLKVSKRKYKISNVYEQMVSL